MSGDVNWDSGIYSYDGVGNITRIGSDWYLYDGLSRLKQGTTRNSAPGTFLDLFLGGDEGDERRASVVFR